MKTVEDGSVRSVLRAFDLLALFTEQRRLWAVKDLTAASGLAKTTVLRLVATCEQRGLLWTRPDGRITVGPGMLRWAHLANTAWQLPEPVRQVLRDLARECRETVNIYVRSTSVLVCVAQQEGPLAIRHVGRVGDELPLGFGAAGRVLDGVEGATVSHGEPEAGASSVAAPVHDGDGRLLAALAITGPSSRFGPGEVAAFTEALTAASVRISQIGLATRAE
ncbi:MULTISPECIES: helix-turn-helix domain-containing protein [unclassified Amycolatopsis]|uniref:IclR family transcriptional regulator n=1 Tax=unclassified Amycolatopsis TaxID=2618356 RepID=UPI002876F173|nr:MULTISPECIES: helix-turn-helix domain-containing protein [unclassified Amycolatopsis]MDS0135510.1 helix-turn-helix domain-containing protein [Amycolatopsis sp. 505]MDS0140799.1 helix-turn-helix domain-containing protein [Amycolatopsis sp. CM201R]